MLTHRRLDFVNAQDIAYVGIENRWLEGIHQLEYELDTLKSSRQRGCDIYARVLNPFTPYGRSGGLCSLLSTAYGRLAAKAYPKVCEISQKREYQGFSCIDARLSCGSKAGTKPCIGITDRESPDSAHV